MRIKIFPAMGNAYVIELDEDMIDEMVQVWIYDNLKDNMVEGWKRED